MEGQYTDEEMKDKIRRAHKKTLDNWLDGRVILQVGRTVNYYMQHSDGSWTNYNCRTTSA